MNKFRIKICGITRPGDARLAASLGADMIGMIFYRRSPRFVTQRQAAGIVAAIPATVRTVGVFVNEPTERVIKVVRKFRLDFVQLHGSEPAAPIKKLQNEGIKVIKGFGLRSGSDWKEVQACKADLVLVDNQSDEAHGGTGRTFDWSLKPKKKIENLMIAGGIGINNIEKVLELFVPCAVDVNSLVETRPGIKSRKKLIELFEFCNRLRYDC